jgi:hypothetical protein
MTHGEETQALACFLMNASVGVYRPRHAGNTPFCRRLDDYWEEFRERDPVRESPQSLRAAVPRAAGAF